MTRRTTHALAALALLFATALAFGAGPASAVSRIASAPPAGERPSFDARAGDRADLSAATDEARDKLAGGLGPQAAVSADPITGGLRAVGRTDGFLTGASDADPATIALGYVRAHAQAFGLDAADIDQLEPATRSTSSDGVTHLTWQQEDGGVPAYDSALTANVAADGRLLTVGGAPVHDLAPPSTDPPLGPAAARSAAQRDLGLTPDGIPGDVGTDAQRTTTFADTNDTAELVTLADPDGDHLAWRLIVAGLDPYIYDMVVDAATGAILTRHSLTDFADNATVFKYHPGAATGGTQESVDLSAWISPTPSCTSSLTLCLSGPNAHVYADRSAPTGITGGTDGDTGPSSGTDFVYPIVGKSPYSSSYACPNVTVPSAPASCTWDGHTASSATSNLNEVTTQVFYYVNAFHDWLKTSAIQFSDHNFEGADPVLAETDDYGGLDNANMWTPPDGASPTMQMYLFDSPAANGGDDATIVYHEYTHGLTNRLVGGDGQANGLDAKQSEAMGEGWSDWYALDFLTADGKITDTSAPGDEVIGAYVTNNTNTGIRYNAIDCPVGATADQHCPGTSSAGSGGFTFADLGLVADYQGTDRPVFEVHADGEIWSETLWDLRTAIGGSAARKLITSALRLSPKAPSFLDMRNAILQADTAAHAAGDPSHHDVIWSVFAQRGMGFSASTSSANATHATAAFDLPPAAAAGAADVTALALEQTTPIHIPIVNIGGTALTGVHATLTAAGGVTVATATADVGSIAAGGSALGTFAVRVPASFGCGTIASFTLTITSSGGTSTVPFAIPVGSGRATAATATLSGAAATIPDDRADTGLTSSLAIGTPGRVGTLRVTLTATHTAVGDLHAWLISPAGTRIDLMENPGGSVGSLANVAAATPLVFDDAATTAIQDVSPSATATGGAFRPNEPLATLAKQSRVGTWTLHVTDTYALDSGTLSSWSLETDEPACAITDAPTGLSADAATLHARLDPGTSATSAVFQIGTTTAYTGESGAMALTASGGLQSVAFSTAGLAAGTTYHVRAVALRNGTLVAAGADQTFVAGSQPATTGPSSSSDATSTTTTATILPTVATARISGLARAVRLDRRGRFTLSFTATPAQAQGTLRVTGGTASAAAAKSFTVPSSGTVKLVVKASTKARAALRRHTALTTKLVFRIGATTITRTLTVKPYKKSR